MENYYLLEVEELWALLAGLQSSGGHICVHRSKDGLKCICATIKKVNKESLNEVSTLEIIF